MIRHCTTSSTSRYQWTVTSLLLLHCPPYTVSCPTPPSQSNLSVCVTETSYSCAACCRCRTQSLASFDALLPARSFLLHFRFVKEVLLPQSPPPFPAFALSPLLRHPLLTILTSASFLLSHCNPSHSIALNRPGRTSEVAPCSVPSVLPPSWFSFQSPLFSYSTSVGKIRTLFLLSTSRISVAIARSTRGLFFFLFFPSASVKTAFHSNLLLSGWRSKREKKFGEIVSTWRTQVPHRNQRLKYNKS